jgi:hypothetical protein
MKSRYWNPERLIRLKDLWESGGWEKLREAFPGKTDCAIQKAANRLLKGLKKLKERDYLDITKWMPEQLEKLKRVYSNSSWEDLKKEFPFSTMRGIQAAANNLGLYKTNRLSNAYLEHDERLFDSWSEKSAYLLGYLEADGCIHYLKSSEDKKRNRSVCVKFATSLKDRDFLELLKVWVGSNATVGVWQNCKWKGKKHYGCRFAVTSRSWVDFLKSHLRTGYIPKDIPSELLHHYIRGYFDGDGSIYLEGKTQRYKSNFVFSNKQLAEEFAVILRTVTGGKLTVYEKTNSDKCWYITISYGVNNLFKNYLYKNASFFLLRKKLLFDKI